MIQDLIAEEAKLYPNNYSEYGTERYYSQPSGDSSMWLRLDKTITDDLLEEGLLNEVIRQVNNERKQAGLQISDRIKLYCPIEFRQSFLDRIKNDCLCDYLTWFNEDFSHKFITKLSKQVEMSFEKSNM